MAKQSPCCNGPAVSPDLLVTGLIAAKIKFQSLKVLVTVIIAIQNFVD